MEDGQGPAYFAMINSLAVTALRGKLGPWGIVPVAGAAISDTGVAARSNIQCTKSVYGR